jgi:ATP-binding cassette, subfamily F, member 3
MLTVSQLSKSFAGRLLFENASLQINRGDRIGLVGANGTGKTTLFSIMRREEPADSGSVTLERGATIGFLPQEISPFENGTILDIALLRSPGALDRTSSEQPQSDAEFDHQTEAKAKRILKGLAFRETDFLKPAQSFSGGWIMRAHLARLLVQQPDLLLLDEPTNHLDLESLVWFQNYLKQYPGAMLLISHDRAFLNALAQHIVAIDRQQLTRFRGNFDAYLAQTEARETQALAAYKNQQREIDRLQTFIDRFGAKNTKAAQAQSKRKQIERMDVVVAPQSAGRKISFQFPQPIRSGRRVLELREVRHAYGPNIVYQSLNLELERGQKIVLVGPNGAGKSTLLKLLGGVLPVQQGLREPGHQVRIGYFSQHRVETLDLTRTVLEDAVDGEWPERTVRALLGAFLFRGDDVFKSIKVLSGGEKSRLALVKLLINPPNLLLMDEPTTHLDMASIDALLGALTQYRGTLVFISHDVHFIQTIATSVIRVSEGQLTFYPGNYQYYLDKIGATSERAGLIAGAANESHNPMSRRIIGSARDRRRVEAESRNSRNQRRREIKDQLLKLERAILALEARQKELTWQLQQPQTPDQLRELTLDLTRVADQLKHMTPEWERLAEVAEG